MRAAVVNSFCVFYRKYCENDAKRGAPAVGARLFVYHRCLLHHNFLGRYVAVNVDCLNDVDSFRCIKVKVICINHVCHNGTCHRVDSDAACFGACQRDLSVATDNFGLLRRHRRHCGVLAAAIGVVCYTLLASAYPDVERTSTVADVMANTRHALVIRRAAKTALGIPNFVGFGIFGTISHVDEHESDISR